MRCHKGPAGVIAALLLVPLMLVLGAAAPASASTTGCWVKNVRTHVVTANLQEAIDASARRDVLKVRGVCGAFSTVDQTVTLKGPATIGWPDLPGYEYAGIVATVDGGRVTLTDLTLIGGSSTYWGGGVHNFGTLILKGYTKVTRNVAEDGAGGIYNEGLLVMKDHAKVTGNKILWGYGAGIWNEGTLVMKDRAKVAGNEGTFGGGVYNSGTLVLRDSSAIVWNRAETGGGVYSTGSLMLKGGARVTRNSAYGGAGGGIYSEGSVAFSLWWYGTVCGNSPDDWPSCTP